MLSTNSGNLKSLRSVFILFVLILTVGCKKTRDANTDLTADNNSLNERGIPPQLLKDFNQVVLVASNDQYGADRVDPTLVNPWGIAMAPSGVFWPASMITGLSQVYNSQGLDVRPPVAIPGPATATGGHPTGVVFNGSANFLLPNGQPARFIFAGVDGVISAWNNLEGNFARRMVNNAGSSTYTGLALANDGGNNFLYAADFQGGEIDVFNTNFAPVIKPFVDPTLPSGYAPFNIHTIDGQLYIMYAKVGPDGRDEASPGNGYISIFNPDGSFVKRFLSRGQLNAPWGIAKAPASFYGDDNTGNHAVGTTILVGNFGDGRINAFTTEGESLGQLRAHGQPIVIEGLWAITFPPATSTVDPNRLYFAAGPHEEQHGIFGYLRK